MKKMMAMLLASVMAAGTFTTTAFAYTGDDVQKNTPVSTAAQETDAAESTNAGKTDNTDSIEIDPDMQVLPDGYEVSTDADGNLIVTVGGKEYNIGSEKSPKADWYGGAGDHQPAFPFRSRHGSGDYRISAFRRYGGDCRKMR